MQHVRLDSNLAVYTHLHVGVNSVLTIFSPSLSGDDFELTQINLPNMTVGLVIGQGNGNGVVIVGGTIIQIVNRVIQDI